MQVKEGFQVQEVQVQVEDLLVTLQDLIGEIQGETIEEIEGEMIGEIVETWEGKGGPIVEIVTGGPKGGILGVIQEGDTQAGGK